MKRFKELNYYEIFDIPFSASSSDIRQAYKDALAIYNEDSMITVSFFTGDERDEILKKIEEAFLTLIDKKKRIDYDRTLKNAGRIDESILTKKDQKKIIPLFQMNKPTKENAYSTKIRKKIREKDVKEISSEILSKELISGNDLKKIRKSLDIEIEEIFEVVRISVSILKAIEDDQIEGLPSAIYLRNFLKSYAEILQLDSERIVDGYLKNIAFDEVRIKP